MSDLQPLEKHKRKMVKEKSGLQKGLYCVLILAVLGVFSGLAVSAINRITAPVIAANENTRLLEMLAIMMPEAEEYKLVTTDNGVDIYFGVKDREILTAVVPGAGKGFNGNSVDVLTIVHPDGRIKEVVIQMHKETPGWGEKIEEPLFLAQFEGLYKNLAVEEEKFEDILVAGVDIISGATISSQAVMKGVAQAMELFTASAVD